MLALSDRARYTTAFLAVMLAAGPLRSQEAVPPQQGLAARESSEASNRALEEIARFYDGQHGVVVANVDQFMAGHATTLENVAALFFKAESEFQLGRTAAAVESYQSALARVEALANNVTQRRFASAHFRLAQILRQQRHLDAALTQVEAGLRLAPQYVEGEILLGHLLAEGGHRDRASNTIAINSLRRCPSRKNAPFLESKRTAWPPVSQAHQ